MEKTLSDWENSPEWESCFGIDSDCDIGYRLYKIKKTPHCSNHFKAEGKCDDCFCTDDASGNCSLDPNNDINLFKSFSNIRNDANQNLSDVYMYDIPNYQLGDFVRIRNPFIKLKGEASCDTTGTGCPNDFEGDCWDNIADYTVVASIISINSTSIGKYCNWDFECDDSLCNNNVCTLTDGCNSNFLSQPNTELKDQYGWNRYHLYETELKDINSIIDQSDIEELASQDLDSGSIHLPFRTLSPNQEYKQYMTNKSLKRNFILSTQDTPDQLLSKARIITDEPDSIYELIPGADFLPSMSSLTDPQERENYVTELPWTQIIPLIEPSPISWDSSLSTTEYRVIDLLTTLQEVFFRGSQVDPIPDDSYEAGLTSAGWSLNMRETFRTLSSDVIAKINKDKSDLRDCELETQRRSMVTCADTDGDGDLNYFECGDRSLRSTPEDITCTGQDGCTPDDCCDPLEETPPGSSCDDFACGGETSSYEGPRTTPVVNCGEDTDILCSEIICCQLRPLDEIFLILDPDVPSEISELAAQGQYILSLISGNPLSVPTPTKDLIAWQTGIINEAITNVAQTNYIDNLKQALANNYQTKVSQELIQDVSDDLDYQNDPDILKSVGDPQSQTRRGQQTYRGTIGLHTLDDNITDVFDEDIDKLLLVEGETRRQTIENASLALDKLKYKPFNPANFHINGSRIRFDLALITKYKIIEEIITNHLENLRKQIALPTLFAVGSTRPSEYKGDLIDRYVEIEIDLLNSRRRFDSLSQKLRDYREKVIDIYLYLKIYPDVSVAEWNWICPDYSQGDYCPSGYECTEDVLFQGTYYKICSQFDTLGIGTTKLNMILLVILTVLTGILLLLFLYTMYYYHYADKTDKKKLLISGGFLLASTIILLSIMVNYSLTNKSIQNLIEREQFWNTILMSGIIGCVIVLVVMIFWKIWLGKRINRYLSNVKFGNKEYLEKKYGTDDTLVKAQIAIIDELMKIWKRNSPTAGGLAGTIDQFLSDTTKWGGKKLDGKKLIAKKTKEAIRNRPPPPAGAGGAATP